MEGLEKLDRNIYSPVIVWGTKTAAEICFRVLEGRGILISAVGDNNIQVQGERLHEVMVLSAEQIKELYPDAMIVIGCFNPDISEKIISGLKLVSGKFSFCRFEQIESCYEIECLGRKVHNRERYSRIMRPVYRDEGCVWKRKTDKGIVSEYRYALHGGRMDDLRRTLVGIPGLKTLYLIVDGKDLAWMPSVMDELLEYDKIGHIVLVTDRLSVAGGKILKRLAERVFYVICGKEESDCQAYFKEQGLLVEFRELSKELFVNRAESGTAVITEECIVQSVLHFAGYGAEESIAPRFEEAKTVHIVQLFNGLANQMLMYLFGRFLEEGTGRTVIFDDTILCLDILDEDENVKRIFRWNRGRTLEDVKSIVAKTREGNSFYMFKRAEIAEILDAPIRLLSDYFDKDVWRRYLDRVKEFFSGKYAQGFPLGQVLIENGLEVAVVRDAIMPDEFLAVKHCFCLDTYVFNRPYEADSVTDYIMHYKETMYCMGIWATGKTEDWLLHNRQWIRQQIAFRMELSGANREYEREIRQSDGVMVHIRRGDFVNAKISADTGYFKQAIAAAEEMNEYRNKKYFIFSDDLEWCQRNEEALGIGRVRDKVVYVSGNSGRESYIDMWLMSLGKVSIPTPGSSYSYMAVLMSETIERCIDIPKYMYGLEYGLDQPTLFTRVDF